MRARSGTVRSRTAGHALYLKIWSLAKAITLDEAVELVTRARGTRKRPAVGWQSLTPNQRRMVELVAEGLSQPQIAERLFIARGTVKVHLAHVFSLPVAQRLGMLFVIWTAEHAEHALADGQRTGRPGCDQCRAQTADGAG